MGESQWWGAERASPPGNGRRGLKRFDVCHGPLLRAGIASRQREAWIETLNGYLLMPAWPRIASRQREAWIETAQSTIARCAAVCIASRQREAWIETVITSYRRQMAARIASRQREAWIETVVICALVIFSIASPPGNGRRGLKLSMTDLSLSIVRIASRQREAWIETWSSQSLCIASRQREAWIETSVTV